MAVKARRPSLEVAQWDELGCLEKSLKGTQAPESRGRGAKEMPVVSRQYDGACLSLVNFHGILPALSS